MEIMEIPTLKDSVDVPEERLELSSIATTASETATFTNFAIRALTGNQADFQLSYFSAHDKIRTCTTLRSPPPQDGVSTNFTTWAKVGPQNY